MQRRSLLRLLTFAAASELPSRGATARSRWFTGQSQPEADRVTPHGTGSGSGPQVFLNQVGYLPGQRKLATVTGVPANESEFRVRRLEPAAGRPFQGTLTAAREDAASGDMLRLADFSGLSVPGRYVLEMDGLTSDPFSIAHDVYAGPLRTTMRAFYGQRCGCEVDLGGGYKHPACHAVGDYHPSSGKTGRVPNGGGWHDAGDYGRYVVNSGITCGTLLWAWELFPEVLRPLRLGIPQTHPHLPDFLAEVLWNLNWMMQLQDGDGGVFQKQTSVQFCGFVMPEQDRMPSEIIGTGSAPFKSTAATADFAAVMSIAARCFASYELALSKRFLLAARRAWRWASAHPAVTLRNPPGVSTGQYGDRDTTDELLWASAELWRTTGEEVYRKAFLTSAELSRAKLRIDAPGWSSVASLAYWTYALAHHPDRDEAQDAIRGATLDAARRLVQKSEENGYGNTLASHEYVWGSNGVAANQSLLLAVADRFQQDANFVDAALGNLHYLLGRNCHGVSFVTQIGTRPFEHPHHRPSVADGIAAPWPGMLSGGPNARPADEVAKQLPKLPPMRMWVDDERAYSMNEIAINWNAPLVFLLAFANAISRRRT